MTDDQYWETIIGFAAVIFASYPAIKDVITQQTGALLAFVCAILFSFVCIASYLIIIKKLHR